MKTGLIESKRKETTFYGDMFNIHGQGALVFGHGKTKACRHAVNQSEAHQISLDFVCLTKDETSLYGHVEFPYLMENFPDPIESRQPINYLVRMLSADETEKMYKGKTHDVTETSLLEFIDSSHLNITFGADGQSAIRMKEFVGLTHGMPLKCLFVPWGESHETKGELLKRYIESC